MPWLVLLARSRVYGPVRIAGAVLTGIAAAAWFVERAFGWVNPIGPIVESVAAHALWILAGLVALTLVATVAENQSRSRERRSGSVLASNALGQQS